VLFLAFDLRVNAPSVQALIMSADYNLGECVLTAWLGTGWAPHRCRCGIREKLKTVMFRRLAGLGYTFITVGLCPRFHVVLRRATVKELSQMEHAKFYLA